MLIRRRQRELPELNTTSTADISFMLLVFFLVTSSMDTDRGLGRRLAPQEQQRQEARDISRSDVLEVTVDGADRLLCDHKAVTPRQLSQQVESFVASRQTDNYVVAVSADRQASYNAYFEMQNAIVAAYRRLRDRMARQRYGHGLEKCSPEERDRVMAKYPQRISEGLKVEDYE